jgi:HSP20 family molecular chaperone IbpA
MIADDIWNDLFGGFESLNRRMEAAFSGLDGANVQTYGYTMYRGPDGIPHIREYGNSGSRIPQSVGARDPVLDISRDGDDVRAVLELPGVPKEDIELSGTDSTLCVTVRTPGKEIVKEIALPCKVDASTAHAECNNGLLEVTVKAAGSAEKVRIEVQRTHRRRPPGRRPTT